MAVDLILVVVLLTNLRLLASSRLGAAIRVTAFQGLVLGLLPLLVHAQVPTWRALVLAVGSAALKAGVFPWLLFRAVREAGTGREMQLYVGPTNSVTVGVLALAGAFGLCSRLPVLPFAASSLLLPIALFSIFSGLVLLVSRRRAVTQVLGFLVMENGIYIFGVGALEEIPVLVELGLLLDVFVAVFVMGIAVYHINREFDHIETDRLAALKG
ncbi:MAG: hydrogenase [Gemmatimonadota bacterium]